MQTNAQNWDEIESELYDPETPLEFYVEMSTPMRVMVNYSIDRFTPETIALLLTSYRSMLTKLVANPELTVAQLLTQEI